MLVSIEDSWAISQIGQKWLDTWQIKNIKWIIKDRTLDIRRSKFKWIMKD